MQGQELCKRLLLKSNQGNQASRFPDLVFSHIFEWMVDRK